MNKSISAVWVIILLGMFCYCTNSEPALPPSGLSGDQLATKYCGSCHEYTPPHLLTKTIWRDDVLPAMGHHLGIYPDGIRPDSLLTQSGNPEVVINAGIFPDNPLLASEDWEKIVDYYTTQAPEHLIQPTENNSIIPKLAHFTYRESDYSRRPSLTTMVKILPEQNGLVFADSKPGINKLIFLDQDLTMRSELNFKTAPIQFDERLDTLLITTIGTNPFPSDRTDGDFQMVYKTGNSQIYNGSSIILPDLKRPVHVAYGDLDQDGQEDIVVSEFGHLTGQVSWYRNTGDGHYKKNVLKNAPGSIRAEITDLNKDGYTDVVVLMSQGREGIYYFQNNGPGTNPTENNITFSEKQLLSFSPLHGSQYFEMHDFNGDGYDDILYVCGDNADKTPILKEYHGLYIFLNDGHSNFTQAWFYRQNGAYKAVAGDFDLDGDLDIASISFFPDYVDHPQESFIYLENTGHLQFIPQSFPQASKGRWMVMDAGDLDQDGDLDIALGSFVYFTPMGDTTGLGQRWMEEGPSVILLENTIK